jgi:hypothetical protein
MNETIQKMQQTPPKYAILGELFTTFEKIVFILYVVLFTLAAVIISVVTTGKLRFDQIVLEEDTF